MTVTDADPLLDCLCRVVTEGPSIFGPGDVCGQELPCPDHPERADNEPDTAEWRAEREGGL